MRTGLKTAFRPSVESIEARLVATAGVVSAMAVHQPKPPHHASHPPKTAAHHAEAQTTVVISTGPGNVAKTTTPPPPSTTSANNSTTNQAWVKIVNMTGEDLEYQIKLGPYAKGSSFPSTSVPGPRNTGPRA